MLPYKYSRSFPQYARLYNAAASPASRLRSAGLVGNDLNVYHSKNEFKGLYEGTSEVPFGLQLVSMNNTNIPIT